jgi:hypothetical protein
MELLPAIHTTLARLGARTAGIAARGLAAVAGVAIEAQHRAQALARWCRSISGYGNKVLKTASSQTRLSLTRRAAYTLLGAAALASLGACGKKERPKADIAAAKITTIGVNSYLWRASLEALSFMPLLQTDSNGGVIVTDWYVNPKNPGERMKVSVTILDEDLRADALRVAASRQVASGGTWVEAPVDAATVQKLEDVILTKARDLRRSAVAG